MNGVYCVLIMAATVFQGTRADTSEPELERRILDVLLAKGHYDPRVRPNGTKDDAIVVKVEVYVIDISQVDDEQEEFTSTMYFRQIWMDSRLAYDDMDGKISRLLLNGEDIWKPDLFFINERQGNLHTISSPNQLIKIMPNGEVLYSIRITETLKCPMNLAHFPLDVQICPMTIESYGYYGKTLQIEWSEGEIAEDLSLPVFQVKGIEAKNCTKSANADYSCLRVEITLSRNLGFYSLHIYIPFCTLIILSWMSFWLDRDFMYLRLGLLMGVMIMAYMLVIHVNDIIPTTSYTKAVDVWNGICLTFIFASLVIFFLVCLYKRKEDERKKDEEGVTVDAGKFQEDTTGQQDRKQEKSKQTKVNIAIFQKYIKQYPSFSQRLDVASKIFFPILFAFFNLLYWCIYSQGGAPNTSDNMF